ncbi:mechanosensitive ion channel family protein [Candidatus Woesearchaeota archaeon]|nr:mechanosensitive ion channel family protein [Candidatus Woesearchaeota archaeon]
MDIPTWITTIPNNSFGKGISVITIILVTIVVERVTRKILKKAFEKSSKRIKVDPTQFTVFKHLLSAIIYVVGIGIAISIIPSLRALSVSLFAGAGVLAVVIGFASQKAFSNLISGVFIAIFKPFRVGDRIKFSDKFGVVEDITLRHTIIRNFENKRYIVPNSVISDETIENYDIGDRKICRWVEFGISYDSDADKAMRIIQEEAVKHPNFFDARTEEQKKNKEPAVSVRVIGYGDFSVNLRAWVWSKDPGAAFVMGCDLNRSIKKRFDKEGIEIPFPYRTIVFKDKKRRTSKRTKRKR